MSLFTLHPSALLSGGFLKESGLLVLAEAAMATYQPLGRVQVQAKLAGYRPPHLIEEMAADVIVLPHDDFIVVACQGSKTVADWGFNLLALPWRAREISPHGWFPRGFVSQQRAVAGRLVGRLRLLLNQTGKRPVFVTGHSMGGWLAVALHRRLAAEGIPVAGSASFNAPRFGTAAAVRHLAEAGIQHRRVVVERGGAADPVSALPPFYKSFGDLVPIRLSANGNRPLGWCRRFVRMGSLFAEHPAGVSVRELRRRVHSSPATGKWGVPDERS